MIALLSAHPFSKLPLHILCFTQYAHDILQTSARETMPTAVTIRLDLAGVAGTAQQSDSTIEEPRSGGPIDVQDSKFRVGQWTKWSSMQAQRLDCQICRKAIDVEVSTKTFDSADD